MARQCFIPPEEWMQDRPVIAGPEAHHLIDVLRAQPGETADLFDGAGRIAHARITRVGGRQVELEIVSRTEIPAPTVNLVLIQGLPRAASMEWIIQKATELGVKEIIPLATRNSVVRIKEHTAARKAERWNDIALNAAKQCGNAWLPHIHPPRSWEQGFADLGRFELLIMGDLQAGTVPLQTLVNEYVPGPGARIGCLIGPEGDLTPEELDQARAAGARSAYFGPLVLRTATAALYAISIMAGTWNHTR